MKKTKTLSRRLSFDYRVFLSILVAILIAPYCLAYGADKDTKSIKSQRFQSVGLYNIKISGEGGGFRESHLASLRVDFCLGSRFTLWGAGVGVGYRVANPFTLGSKESVSARHIPFFLSAELHPLRFKTGYLYLGTEAIFNLSIGGRHFLPAEKHRQRDSNLSSNCITGRANLGVKFHNFAVYTFFEYDMQPSFNQKYIYETLAYDYRALKNTIFERYRLGIGLSYYFNL